VVGLEVEAEEDEPSVCDDCWPLDPCESCFWLPFWFWVSFWFWVPFWFWVSFCFWVSSWS
jgi:hypothetical protein